MATNSFLTKDVDLFDLACALCPPSTPSPRTLRPLQLHSSTEIVLPSLVHNGSLPGLFFNPYHFLNPSIRVIMMLDFKSLMCQCNHILDIETDSQNPVYSEIPLDLILYQWPPPGWKLIGHNLKHVNLHLNRSNTMTSARTKNFSGAEIEGLVKSAVSFALNRQVDVSDLSKPIDEDNIKVWPAGRRC